MLQSPALAGPAPSHIETLVHRVQPAGAARAMLWSIAGFSVLMLSWAGFARISETAVATGRVVPQRQLQVVSNLEGGTVQAILARPGQRVAAGAVLLRLDPALAAAEFGRSSAATNALAARIARLEAETTGVPLHFPASLAAAAPSAVAAEIALFSARQAELAAGSSGDGARIEGARRALGQARADQRARAEASAQARREAAMLALLVDKGIEPAISLDRARSGVVQAQAAEAAAVEAVRHAEAGIAEASAGKATGQGRFHSQAGDALAAARAEYAGQIATLPALETRMARTEITSPIAGIVQRMLVATVGGSVAPGAPLAEIVPAGDALMVEADVRPADIAFVHLGQPAMVKITAYESSVYGALQGRVERISPDAVVNERTGESHYQVRIVTSAGSLKAPDGMMLPIGAGMVAEVNLIGHKRSILSYLLSPVTKLRENAFRER
jgi:adhesin transport system membrane fusion protein